MSGDARVEFIVEGRHAFPVDMLRYDCCFPKRGQDAGVITSSFRNHGEQPQRVTLVGLHTPTHDRWISFGWRVVT